MKMVDKKELFNKLSNISPQELKKLDLSFDDIEYIKTKLLNDKLGLTLNFIEVDEDLKWNYFGLKHEPKYDINSLDKNNHLIIEGDNYYGLKALNAGGGVSRYYLYRSSL